MSSQTSKSPAQSSTPERQTSDFPVFPQTARPSLRQFVEHVRRLMDPAALLTHLAPDLADGFPEAEGAVRDDELGRQFETSVLQIEQQFLP
jgi:hypothetical protein